MEFIVILGTIGMLACCLSLIAAVVRIGNVRKYMEERNAYYLQRLSNIEDTIAEDLKNILSLLKK